MREKPIQLIYLLGAGRSGTTMLTTVLNTHSDILAVGEMHQFLDYVKDNKDCSCGAVLDRCPFWGPIVATLDVEKLKRQAHFSNALEWHTHIPKHILKKQPNVEYNDIVNHVFGAIEEQVKTPWLLDSSKYISRYLLLKKNKKFKVKGIYMVRDIRGVIHSFGKQVQTPKSPISAIIYYILINFWGQLISWFDKDVLQIKYEDFVNHPEDIFQKIEHHIFGATTKGIAKENTFKIPHIIAGNRLRSQDKLVIKKDIAWKEKIPRGKQIIFYVLAWPTMLINRYKP